MTGDVGAQTAHDLAMDRVVSVRQSSLIEAGTRCIVNASNDSGTLGGGVSRAIFDECGGRVPQDEMRTVLEDEFACCTSRRSTTAGTTQSCAADGSRGRGARPRVRLGGFGVPGEFAVGEAITVSIGFPLLGAGSGGLAPCAACDAMLAEMQRWLGAEAHEPIESIVLAVPKHDTFVICDEATRRLFGSG